jgi:hypothetical protein
MTPDELRAAISASGLAVDQFAEAVGRSGRSIRYCLRGEKPIKRTLELAVHAVARAGTRARGDVRQRSRSAGTPEELRAAMGVSGMPVDQFAEAVGRTVRSLEYCLKGERPITRTLEIAIQQVLEKENSSSRSPVA